MMPAITPYVRGGMLVLSEIPSDVFHGQMCFSGIPVVHAKAIKSRMEQGMDYISASPLLDITREQAAVILAISWDELDGK